MRKAQGMTPPKQRAGLCQIFPVAGADAGWRKHRLPILERCLFVPLPHLAFTAHELQAVRLYH